MINQIEHAGQLLKEGKVVAFPTETVYGLGADATNITAVKKVFAIKQRPTDHPLIVHISSTDKIALWAKNVPDAAYTLAKYAWPGPLTIVLEKKEHVSDIITGGQDTIALRIPKHPVALALLRNLDGMVGPSANAHCHISPTSAAHVARSLGDKVDYIVDGGLADVGIESTIVSCLHNKVTVLRQGMISPVQISTWLGYDISANNSSVGAMRVPGNLKKHYAPNVLTTFYSPDTKSTLKTKKVAFLTHNAHQNLPNDWSIIQMPNSPDAYAKELYAKLHSAEAQGVDAIVIERPPTGPMWAPLHDKLDKATSITR